MRTVRGRAFALKSRLERKFNIPPRRFVDLLVKQNFLCGGCERPMPKICVDHDRRCCPGNNTCGKCVRGLLCPSCNLAL